MERGGTGSTALGGEEVKGKPDGEWPAGLASTVVTLREVVCKAGVSSGPCRKRTSEGEASTASKRMRGLLENRESVKLL